MSREVLVSLRGTLDQGKGLPLMAKAAVAETTLETIYALLVDIDNRVRALDEWSAVATSAIKRLQEAERGRHASSSG